MHSRCFSCGICPEPLVSDSQQFSVRASEKEFSGPSTAHSCELSRARVRGTPGVEVDKSNNYVVSILGNVLSNH